MNDDAIAAQLKALPPDLPQAPDRFDQVLVRVRHRRRVKASIAVAAVLLIGLPATLLITGGSSSDSRVQIATDPTPVQPTPSTSPTNGPTATTSPGRGTITNDAPPGSTLPGGNKVTALSDPLTATHAGTATVDLGSRPPRANAVSVSLSCLSPGTITFPNGASVGCDKSSTTAPGGPPTSPDNVMTLRPGQTDIAFDVSDGASWQVTTYYVRAVRTPWAINANGDTYGVENQNGSPDLIRVLATNGVAGYSYVADLEGPTPTSPAEATQMQQDGAFDGPFFAPVYESDGETRIGTFRFG